jgi:hypothetical protein
MGNLILILGESGTGKSASLETLNPLETFIFNSAEKPLPFKGSKTKYKTILQENGTVSWKKSNMVNERNIRVIKKKIVDIAERRPEIKNIVSDDLGYALLSSVFERFDETGYNKYKTFAKELKDLIDATKNLREDLNIILINHIEYDTDAMGARKVIFKMPAGKFTKEAMVPEGLFDTVLYSECAKNGEDNIYFFRTQNSGNDTCKSPAGMFPGKRIPNDMQYVITVILLTIQGKNYRNLNP